VPGNTEVSMPEQNGRMGSLPWHFISVQLGNLIAVVALIASLF